MELEDADFEDIVDEIQRRGRSAVLVHFRMPAAGRNDAKTLSRSDIQSLGTDDIGDCQTLYQLLRSIGEIAEAALKGAPQLPVGPVEPYELKGDRLGLSLSEFKAKHRRTVGGTTAPYCSSSGPTSQPWHAKARIVHCRLDSPLEDKVRTVGGVETSYLLYEFIDDKLFRISAAFSNDDFSTVKSSVEQKYGPVMRSDKASRELVWGNGISSIFLMRGKSKAEGSHLVFQHEELAALVEDRRSLGDPDL